MFFKRVNFDYDYVLQRTKENDDYWNFPEKNLYYSVENPNCILPSICGCIFFGLCGVEGIIGIVFVLLIAKLYCDYNNLKLDINPNIVKQRQANKEYWIRKKNASFSI